MEKFLMERFLWLLLLLGLVIFSPAGAQGQQVIKVGSIPIAQELPLHAARINGYFQQEGLKVDLQPLAGGAALIPALVGGSLQMGHSTYISVFPAREQGLDIVVVAPYGGEVPGKESPSRLLVRQDSPIKGARDLEGKTVALNVLKSINWLYAVEWLKAKGGDPNKVQWIEVPFPNMIPALRTGQVEAAFATEPFVTLELERAGLRVLAHPFTEVDPALEVSGVIATEKWARANADLVTRFARAVRKGVEYVNAYPEKRGEILASYTRLQPEVIAKVRLPGYRSYVDLERLQAGADLALKWGLLKKRLAVKGTVWPTALR